MTNNIYFEKMSFEKQLAILEQQVPKTFLDLNPDICNYHNLRYIFNFLYHGIRFQNHLEKLESIFQDKAILAGNYQQQYHSYSDNCNEGEYISLLSTDGSYDLEYETFILPNITLIISPLCDAIKTIYLPFKEWLQIKDKPTQNRYSYARNEYQVKQMIPISMVKGIGVPASYLKERHQEEKLEIYLNDILKLMNKYNIFIPIVDTSFYNKPIISTNHHILKKVK